MPDFIPATRCMPRVHSARMTTASDTPVTDPAPTADEIAAARAVIAASTADPAADVDELADDATDDTDAPADEDSDDVEVWKHEDDWPYDSLSFHGDILGIRIPKVNAVQAWQLSQSSSNSDAFQLNGTNRLLTSHMSPESYARFIYRLGEPDDPDYDEDTYAEIVDALVTPARERAQADAEARAKVTK